VRAFFDRHGLHTPEPTIVRDGEEFRIFARLEAGERPRAAEVVT